MTDGPKTPPFGTIPYIACDFAESKLTLSFQEGEPRFFYVGMPFAGRSIAVPIEELEEIIECLNDIGTAALLARV
jgi:hypothetical protein